MTFDTLGAQLVKAELLNYTAPGSKDQPMVLFDNVPSNTYLAQTGVIGAPQGASYPTHLTPFTLVSQGRSLEGDKLDVVFEAQSDGLRVVKTYTLRRGSYDIDVRHDIYNVGSQPVSPSLYLQLTRDSNDPGDKSAFYSTFTGPALYSAEEKFQKIPFKDIDKGNASYVNRRQLLDRHWCSTTSHRWLLEEGVNPTTKPCPVQQPVCHPHHRGGRHDPAGPHIAVDSSLWVGPLTESHGAPSRRGSTG